MNKKKKKEGSINLVEIHKKSINERKNRERKLNGWKEVFKAKKISKKENGDKIEENLKKKKRSWNEKRKKDCISFKWMKMEIYG